MLKRALFISLLAFVLLAPSALARSEVEVDRSFGSHGVLGADLGPTYWSTAFTSVVPEADGGLLATREGGSGDWIRRYTSAGARDHAFAPVAPSPVPADIDADGKTVRLFPATPEGSIERLNPDGTPDLTFGVQHYANQSLSEPAGFKIETIEVLSSGKILVGGTKETDEPVSGPEGKGFYVEQVALARFDHDGRLDPGFGNGGVVRLKTDAGTAGVRLAALVPRPDEGVAVAVLDSEASNFGEADAHTGSTIAVLKADGRPDASYGSDGAIRVADAALFWIHALPGGELLAAGDRWGPEFLYGLHESDVLLARYTAAGAPDPSFGDGDGSVVLDLSGLDLFGSAFQAEDGSVWLGGSSTDVANAKCRRYYAFCTETPFVAHMMPGGTLDPGFGGSGVALLDRLSFDYARREGGKGVLAFAPRAGGGVFAAGGSGAAAFIAALTPRGEPDPGFGDAGFLTEADPRPSEASAQSLAVDSHGRVLVAGEATAGLVDSLGAPALVRYLPDGALDRAFAGGLVRAPGRQSGVVVGEGDTYFILSGRSDGAVTKVRSSGEIERSFGMEGTADISLGPAVDYRGKSHRIPLDPRRMVALPGGRLLIAGGAGRSSPHAFVLRLRADGTPDPSFGDDGFALLSHRDWTLNQLAVQRDGRVIVAGLVERPWAEEQVAAVLRLRRDGRRDGSFGHRGLTLLPVARISAAYALAIEGDGRVIVAGEAFGRANRAREFILRLDAHGALDRSFGRRGMVVAPVPYHRGGLWGAPRQVLLQRHRILVLRDSAGRQLLVYSRDGRRRSAFSVGRGAEIDDRGERHRWVVAAPRAAVQGHKLLLAWTIFRQNLDAFRLQRLELRGDPSS